MPMVGVHHDRHAREAGRKAPEQAGLRGMRVDDRRTELPDHCVNRPKRPKIGQRTNLSPQAGERNAIHPLLVCEVEQVAFSGSLLPDDEPRLIPSSPQAGGEQDDVDGGPAYVEPRKDPENTNASCGVPRLRGRSARSHTLLQINLTTELSETPQLSSFVALM